MFSVVILFHHWFPLLEMVEIRAFILPRKFPAVLIIFTGRGGAGNPPLPTALGGAGNPPFPAGRVPHGTGRPSLIFSTHLTSSRFGIYDYQRSKQIFRANYDGSFFDIREGPPKA